MAKKQTKKTKRWRRKRDYRQRKKQEIKEAFIKTILFRKFQENGVKTKPEKLRTDCYPFNLAIEEIYLNHKELMEKPREILFRKFQ